MYQDLLIFELPATELGKWCLCLNEECSFNVSYVFDQPQQPVGFLPPHESVVVDTDFFAQRQPVSTSSNAVCSACFL